MDMDGTTFDDAKGTILFKESFYQTEEDDFYFDDFQVISSFDGPIRTIQIDSPDIIQGSISGEFLVEDIPNLFRNGTHLKDHLMTATASQDDNDVFFLIQTERTWSRAKGGVLSVYHMALPPGSHIFKKFLFNSEAWNLHRLECAIAPLPHAGSGVGINYDKYHDGNPGLPAAFVGYSQIISEAMEGHRLGLRDHGSEIDPVTKKLYFKKEETPKFVSNDVTGDVYFESSDEE